MITKTFILAALASASSMWLLAGLWHTLLMVTFYIGGTHAQHDGVGIIFIAYIILGILMTYLYQRLYMGERSIVYGLKFGVVIGLLWVFPHELVMAGAHSKSISYVFRNAAWHLVEQGLGGVIIAIIYKRASTKTRPQL